MKNKGLNRRFCNENYFFFSVYASYSTSFSYVSFWEASETPEGGKKAVKEGLGLSVCFTVII